MRVSRSERSSPAVWTIIQQRQPADRPFGFHDSHLEFGDAGVALTGSDAFDFYRFPEWAAGDEWAVDPIGDYAFESGPVVSKSILVGSLGLQRRYRYEGGTFSMNFVLRKDGQTRSGMATASVRSMDIFVNEWDGSVESRYSIGPGQVRGDVREALDIHGDIVSGVFFALEMRLGDGDDVSGIHASGGDSVAALHAPEPVLVVLSSLGICAVAVRRRVWARAHRPDR